VITEYHDFFFIISNSLWVVFGSIDKMNEMRKERSESS